MPGAPFAIHQLQDQDQVRLSLEGELDLASTPLLDDRLTRLRAKKRAVRLDLSRLEFIDSTGLRLLIRAVGDARASGWHLEISGDLAPTVRGLFKLVHFDQFVGADGERPETAA
jgi:anti-anti-sigma factor